MASISKLQVQIKVQSSKARKEMNEFKQKAIKSVRDVQKEVDKLNKSLQNTRGAGLAKAGNAAAMVAAKTNKATESVKKTSDAFDKVGKSGKKAGKEVEKGMRGVVRTNSRVLNQIAKIRRSFYLTRFAVKPLLAVFGGLVGFGAVGAVVGRTAERVKELSVWSKTLGVSTQNLEKWAFAGKSIGFSFEKVADIFKDVNDKVGEFVLSGKGEAAEIFKTLGVSADQLAGKRPGEVLQVLADAVSNLGTQQQTTAFEAIANDSSKWLPLLRSNGKGLLEIFGRFEKLDIALKPEEILNIQGFQLASSTLVSVFSSLITKISAALAPGLTEITNNILMSIEKAGGISQVAQNVVESFGPLFSSIKSGAIKAVNQLGTIANGFLAVGRAAGWAAEKASSVWGGAINTTRGVAQILTDTFTTLDSAAFSAFNSIGLGETAIAKLFKKSSEITEGISTSFRADRSAYVKGKTATPEGSSNPLSGILSKTGKAIQNVAQASKDQAAATNEVVSSTKALTQAQIDARKAQKPDPYTSKLNKLRSGRDNSDLASALERFKDNMENPYRYLGEDFNEQIKELFAPLKELEEKRNDTRLINDAKSKAGTDANVAFMLENAGISFESKVTEAGTKFLETVQKGNTFSNTVSGDIISKNRSEEVVRNGIAKVIPTNKKNQEVEVTLKVEENQEALFKFIVDQIKNEMQSTAEADPRLQ